MDVRIEVLAPAKVNLCLEVGRLREDGFHEIRTILQALELADELVLWREGTSPEMQGEVRPAEAGIPAGEGNLCWRAFRAYRERAGVGATGTGIHLLLTKRIPVAAGLGGGSSDAAATLLGLNILCGEPLGHAELEELAAGLGSDVSFFMTGGTALAEGRGERVRRLASAPPIRVVLAKPPRGLAAGDVYGALDRMAPAARRVDRGLAQAWEEALRSGEVVQLERLMTNGLEEAAVALAPECGALIRAAAAVGARAMVSGSGTTVFALADSAARAAQIETAFGSVPCEIFASSFRQEGLRVTRK
ncbi:MAG: 4-(cytidine 5'-diphospho)-2-C-methyl-D-erythritol kinase [Candidatus Geothermincolia bacterium]